MRTTARSRVCNERHPMAPLGAYRDVIVAVVVLLAVISPAAAWTSRQTNSEFAVGTFFAHRWNVSMTVSRGEALSERQAIWELGPGDEDNERRVGEGILGTLVELKDNGDSGRACTTSLSQGASALEGRLVQTCGGTAPSVYELSFKRLDENVLMSSGTVTRGGDVVGMHQVTVASPTQFTLTVTKQGGKDVPTVVRTLTCTREEQGRSLLNKISLGVLCLALVLSQVFVKRKMRASFKRQRAAPPPRRRGKGD